MRFFAALYFTALALSTLASPSNADIFRSDIRMLWVDKDQYRKLYRNVVDIYRPTAMDKMTGWKPQGVCRAYDSSGQLVPGRLDIQGNGPDAVLSCFILDKELTSSPDRSGATYGQRGERLVDGAFDFLAYNTANNVVLGSVLYKWKASIGFLDKDHLSARDLPDPDRVAGALPHLLDVGGKDDEITPLCFVTHAGHNAWQPETRELVKGTGVTVPVFNLIKVDGKYTRVQTGSKFIEPKYNVIPASWRSSQSGKTTYIGQFMADGTCRYVNFNGSEAFSPTYTLITDSGINHANRGFWVPALGLYNAEGAVSTASLRFDKTILNGQELKPTFTRFDPFDTLNICRTSNGSVGTILYLSLEGEVGYRCAAINENGHIVYDDGNFSLLLSYPAATVRAVESTTPGNAIYGNGMSPICLNPYTPAGVAVGFWIEGATGPICRALPTRAGVITESKAATSYILVASASKTDSFPSQSFTMEDIGIGAPKVSVKANLSSAKPLDCSNPSQTFQGQASVNDGFASAGTVSNFKANDNYAVTFCNQVGAGARGSGQFDKDNGLSVEGEAGAYVKSESSHEAGGSYGVLSGSVRQGVEASAGAEAEYQYVANWGDGKYGYQSEGGFFVKAGADITSEATYGLGNSKLGAKGGIGVGGAGLEGNGTMMLDGDEFTVGFAGTVGIGLVNVTLGFNLTLDGGDVAYAAKVGGAKALNGILFVTGKLDGEPVHLALDIKKGAVQGYSVVSKEAVKNARKFAQGVVWGEKQVVGGVISTSYKIRDGFVSFGRDSERLVKGKILPAAAKIGDGVINAAYKVDSLAKTGAITITDGAETAIDTTKEAGLLVSKSITSAAYWTKGKVNYVADKVEDLAKTGGKATADFFTNTVGGGLKKVAKWFKSLF